MKNRVKYALYQAFIGFWVAIGVGLVIHHYITFN